MHAATNAGDARRSGVFQPSDKEADIMLEARKTRTKSPVHSGFNEQRQPLLRGDARNYMIARGRPSQRLQRSAILEFFLDLIAGTFGRPKSVRTRASTELQTPWPIRV